MAQVLTGLLSGMTTDNEQMAVLAYYNLQSTKDNVAAAGNNQATAYQLVAAHTRFTTVGSGQGATLPQTANILAGIITTELAGIIGLKCTVANVSAVALVVYPNLGDGANATINGVIVPAGYTVAAGTTTSFACFAPGEWVVYSEWPQTTVSTPAGSVLTFQGSASFNTAGVATGVLIGTVPVGKWIKDLQVSISPAFNAGTTNVLTLGTVNHGSAFAGATNLAQATDLTPTSTGTYVLSRGWGPSIAASVAQDVYVKYTQTGSAANAGTAAVLVEYT